MPGEHITRREVAVLFATLGVMVYTIVNLGCSTVASEVVRSAIREGQRTSNTSNRQRALESGKGSVEGYAWTEGGEQHAGLNVAIDGTKHQTTTNDKGFYRLPNLPTGTYTVTITLAGYVHTKSPAFFVPSGDTTQLAPLILEPAALELVRPTTAPPAPQPPAEEEGWLSPADETSTPESDPLFNVRDDDDDR